LAPQALSLIFPDQVCSAARGAATANRRAAAAVAMKGFMRR
jgi:hypothetical protein